MDAAHESVNLLMSSKVVESMTYIKPSHLVIHYRAGTTLCINESTFVALSFPAHRRRQGRKPGWFERFVFFPSSNSANSERLLHATGERGEGHNAETPVATAAAHARLRGEAGADSKT